MTESISTLARRVTGALGRWPPLPLLGRRRARTPLAWLGLVHHRRRLGVSIAGIALAVVLMFMQVGFENAMYDSQTELIRRLNADLVVVSKVKFIVYAPEPFASRRLQQARACPGVQEVCPVYVETFRSLWKNPLSHTTRPLRVLACSPDDRVFLFPEADALAAELNKPDTVLFDERSRDYYGRPGPGTMTELAHHTVRVVGTFRLGTDFWIDGNVLVSERTFRRLFPGRFGPAEHLSRIDIGIVRLEDGADLRQVQRALRAALPDDVDVLTREEMIAQERHHWKTSTAIGYIFMLGTWVGLAVGLIICYQILFTNVVSYLPQLATLKAIGYSDRFLVGVVLRQALLLAGLGFLPALALSQLLYALIGGLTGLLMQLTVLRAAWVLVLTIGMCMTAGALALTKVLQADPAEVFG